MLFEDNSIIQYAGCLSQKLKEMIEIKNNFQIKSGICNESFTNYLNKKYSRQKIQNGATNFLNGLEAALSYLQRLKIILGMEFCIS